MNKYKLTLFLWLMPGMPIHAATLAIAVKDPAGKPLVDAVVYLQATGSGPGTHNDEIRIEQKDKEFRPFVSVAAVGTTAYFPNHDGIGHHVYSFSPAKTFELPLSEEETSTSVIFDQPGIITVGCNIHDWMVGYIQVVDTPYYGITAGDGRLALNDIPAGNYTIFVWHPGSKTGTAMEQPLAIDANVSLQQEFVLDIRPEVFWKPVRPPENEEEQY